MNMVSIKIVFRFALINIIFVNITVFGDWKDEENIYRFQIITSDGKYTSLYSYKDKALLVFNFSTHVSKTQCYKDMLKLGKNVKQDGEFFILAFKSNTFNKTKKNIKGFSLNELNAHNINVFPCKITSSTAHVFWKYLKLKTKHDTDPDEGMEIQGDYTMFIVNKSGMPVYRFEPGTDIMEVITKLNEQLVVKVSWENTTDGASSSPSNKQLEKTVPLENTAGGASSSKKLKLLGTTINIEE